MKQRKKRRTDHRYSIVAEPDTDQSGGGLNPAAETVESGMLDEEASLNDYLKVLEVADLELKQFQHSDFEKEFELGNDEDGDEEEIVGPGDVKQVKPKTQKDLGEKAVEVLEELVKLLMVHSNTEAYDEENLKMYNLGKVIQSAFMGKNPATQSQDILSQLTLLKMHAQAEMDRRGAAKERLLSESVQSEINQMLQAYINSEINRVMEETESLAKPPGDEADNAGECPAWQQPTEPEDVAPVAKDNTVGADDEVETEQTEEPVLPAEGCQTPLEVFPKVPGVQPVNPGQETDVASPANEIQQQERTDDLGKALKNDHVPSHSDVQYTDSGGGHRAQQNEQNVHAPQKIDPILNPDTTRTSPSIDSDSDSEADEKS